MSKIKKLFSERKTPPPPPGDQMGKLQDEIMKLDREFRALSDRRFGLNKQAQSAKDAKNKKSLMKAEKESAKEQQKVWNKRDKLRKKLADLESKFL